MLSFTEGKGIYFVQDILHKMWKKHLKKVLAISFLRQAWELLQSLWDPQQAISRWCVLTKIKTKGRSTSPFSHDFCS